MVLFERHKRFVGAATPPSSALRHLLSSLRPSPSEPFCAWPVPVPSHAAAFYHSFSTVLVTLAVVFDIFLYFVFVVLGCEQFSLLFSSHTALC